MKTNDEKNVATGGYDNLDEIVFEGRNKQYGAYWIRKKYGRALTIAFFFSFVVIGTALIVPLLNAYANKDKVSRHIEKTTTVEMKDVNDAPPPPPPPPPPPAALIKQVAFVAPEVVDSVKPEETVNLSQLIENTANEEAPTEFVEEKPEQKVIQEEVEEVFVSVEEPATFQGGDLSAFHAWAQGSIVYPPEAAENNLFGKVTVQFCVNKHGKVCDVKILKGVHPILDNAVVNCIMKSPAWTPAKQGGKEVKQSFVIPIVFNLQ
jgi:protein TonB